MGEAKPISAGQKALWLLHQLAPASSAYNIAFGLRIEGPLDVAAFRSAVDTLLDSHEILRSRFPLVDDEPRRVPLPADPSQFQVYDAEGLDEGAARQLVERFCREPFALEFGPVFRVLVVWLAPDDAIMVLSAHHIATDAISHGTVLEELMSIYAGQAWSKESRARTFDDYVARERRILASSRRSELESYWRQAYDGASLVLDLPRDRPRPPVQSFAGVTRELTFGQEHLSLLRTATAAVQVTPFVYLLSAFQVLLCRYTRAEDFLVACPTTTRFSGGMRDAIGYLVNSVGVRVRLSPHDTLRQTAERTKRALLAGVRHIDLPFSAIPQLVNAPHDSSRPPVCQVAFTMVATDQRRPLLDLVAAGESGGHRLALGPLTVRAFDIAQQEGQFDLAVEALLSSTTLRLLFRYDTALYEVTFIDQMIRHFERLLDTVLVDPDAAVGRIPLLDDAESSMILALGNTSATSRPDPTRTMAGATPWHPH